MRSLEVLFTPADFNALIRRDLSSATCVVFDVLRATSTIVTALWNGAVAILPVEEIAEAIAIRSNEPGVLLGGERDGVRIPAALAGGTDFHLGNSPREFSPSVVKGKSIVITTTNGTRALHSCRGARQVLAASFLNLGTTKVAIQKSDSTEVLLICSGTFEQAAYEDVLGAGALCDMLWTGFSNAKIDDSAQIARELFLSSLDDPAGSVSRSRNARRLLSKPELSEDVAFCFQRDVMPLVATMDKDGWIRRQL